MSQSVVPRAVNMPHMRISYVFFFSPCNQFFHLVLLMVQKLGKYYVLFAWNNKKQWPCITILQLLAAPDEGKM